MIFLEGLRQNITANNSLLCVGLDTDVSKIPAHLQNQPEPAVIFNRAIIDATHDAVSSFKINRAFYEARDMGLQDLRTTIGYLREHYPNHPVILDAKYNDIGNTAAQYAKAAFEVLGVDAVTVNPSLGYDAVRPFLDYTDRGIIMLCRTSNPSARDFQDLVANGEPMYMQVARKIVEWNEKHGNCLMVIGATYPEEMGKIRELTPDMFFLVPGIGTQGGDLEATLKNGLTVDGSGLIIHSASGIIYASGGEDFAEVARKKAVETRDAINSYRHEHS